MDFLRRATGPALIAWPVLVVVVVWSTALTLLGGGSSVTGGLFGRAASAAIAGVAAYAFIWLSDWLLLRRLSGGARIVTGLVAVVIAGLVRGLVLQLALVELGLAESGTSGLLLRLATSVATVPAAILITAGAVAAVTSYRESAARLLAEQQRLVALIDVSAVGIEERQAEALDRVQDRLDAELQQLAAGGAPSAVAALEAFAGEVVRPLSHSLDRELPRWESELPQEAPRVRWTDVLRDPEPTVAIRPLILSVAILVMAIPTALLIYQPRYGVAAAAVGLAVLLTFLSVGRWLLNRRPPRTPLTSWLAIVGVLLVTALATSILTNLVDGSGPSSGVFPAVSFVVVPVFGLLIATVSMMGARMRENTAQLEAVTRQLQWSLARMNARQWEQSGRLSRALHGPVQSMLHARLLRLRRQMEAGEIAQVDLEELRADLQSSLISALAPMDAPRPVADVLNEVTETWDGVARVTCQVFAAAGDALAADQLCTQVVTDLATEAVSNAVRHGGATSVEVSINMDEHVDGLGLVVLRVVDDGKVPEEGLPGLGTALLTRCTYDWSLSRTVPTTLVARLPVVVSESRLSGV